jgi:hypothetical protein
MSTYPATIRSLASTRRVRAVAIWVALGVALIGAVVVLALNADDSGPSRSVIDGAQSRPIGPHYRFDGGPIEGTRGAANLSPVDTPVTRFDGGPQEGTRGAANLSPVDSAVTRFDGGPQEGTRGTVVSSATVQAPAIDRGPRAGHVGDAVSASQLPATSVSSTRFDGGPDEGTRGAAVAPVEYVGTTRFDGGPDEGTRGH